MRYGLTVIIATAALLWGCAGSRNIERHTSVEAVSQARNPGSYSMLYSLPKTTIRVNIEAVKTITRPGPYHQYAERYLGIAGAPSQESVNWRIGNVEIETYQEADPDHYYLVKTNDPHVANFFRLEKEGFILPVNARQLPELGVSSIPDGPVVSSPLYRDLSMHPRVVEQSRTVMRMVRQDTAFVNVPVMERQSVTKSLEARAAEVADLIYELRSNRFKLLSGDLDLFPDGKALEEIIKEFARIENEYINLFTGKVFEIRQSFTFDYTPGSAPGNDTEHAVLFRFSDTGGIMPENDLNGRPFSIEIRNENKTGRIQRVSASTPSTPVQTGMLLYRIPDVAGVIIADENSKIAETRLLINQYGKLVNLPADLLW